MLLVFCLWSDWRLTFPDATPGRLGDLGVYVDGSRWMRSGRALYDFRTGNGLGFTYPPIAAILFLPLTYIGIAIVEHVWTVVNLILVLVLAHLLVGRLVSRQTMLIHVGLVAVTASVMLQSVPIQSNLVNGQINLLLVVLVVLDGGQFVAHRRCGGLLVGVATAIKLTPGLFAVHDLVTGQWRRASGAVVGFAVLTVIGLFALPGDSVNYWGGALFDTSRVGQYAYLGNHSIRGVLARLGVDGVAATVVWALASASLLVFALRRSARLTREGRALAALGVVGCATILLSPISWQHHEVWLTMSALVLVACGDLRSRLFGVAVLALYILWGPINNAVTGSVHGLGVSDLPFLAALLLCVAPFGWSRGEGTVLPT